MIEEKKHKGGGRRVADYRTCSKSCYEEFCKNHPNISISYKQFNSIIYTYNRMFRDYVLETGEKFKMPHGFGEVSIRKWKKQKVNTHPITGEQFIVSAIDWIKTLEKGKHVYLMNNHTDGFRFQWKWFREGAMFEGRNVFVLNPTRESSRKIAEYIKKYPNHYHKYREWPKS